MSSGHPVSTAINLVVAAHPALESKSKANLYIDEFTSFAIELFRESAHGSAGTSSAHKLRNPSPCKIEIYSLSDLELIVENLIQKLAISLNVIHGTNFDPLDWKRVVGHWVEEFTAIHMRLANNLQSILMTNDAVEAKFFSIELSEVIPFDSHESHMKSMDPFWQSKFFELVLDSFGNNSIISKQYVDKPLNNKSNTATSFKLRIYNLYNWLLRQLARTQRNQKYFILNSYLPRKVDFLLNLRLRQLQVPRYVLPIRTAARQSVSYSQRKELENLLLSQEFLTEFEHRNAQLVSKFMPIIYVEAFKSRLEEIRNSKSLPKSPRVVFTSNNFHFDEDFKIWISDLKSRFDTTYIVGQHGNNYGALESKRFIERETADAFFTWGWTLDPQLDTAVFNFKIAGIKCTPTKTGPVVIMQDMYPYPTAPYDQHNIFFDYVATQVNLVRRILEMTALPIKLRLHPNVFRSQVNELQIWQEENLANVIDTSQLHPYKLWQGSSLVIHTYDSTGLLETLALNIPTLAFWEKGIEYMNPAAKLAYQKLIDAGILHLTLESLLNKFKEIQKDTLAWWRQEFIQECASDFCNTYSRIENKPSSTLAHLLKTK